MSQAAAASSERQGAGGEAALTLGKMMDGQENLGEGAGLGPHLLSVLNWFLLPSGYLLGPEWNDGSLKTFGAEN